ncbi:AAA family ATPase [Butyrivibrio sp. TB]|uniref:AAA family ATPase n=1 Tax=Butyrivibrio sp. TB TaxID=1520809 RepID=UPI0008D57566|nr:AAA family ATPase [Butyrivibrio sp. TB]SEQ64744.1 Predicted ATPase [Butyrivibrio sp. TB]
MINKFEIENLGPIENAKIDDLGKINLVIGENGAGKSFLLKALYAIHKTAEEYGKGDDIRRVNDIIADKLRWTFQADALGELVNNSSTTCNVLVEDNHSSFSIKFGKKATVAINDADNNIGQLNYNSVFIPAREVFSIQKIILRSRDIDKVFGFDDSQYDLARALQLMPANSEIMMKTPRDGLMKMMGGSIELDENSNKWQYVKDGIKYTIGTASDGIRKLGMLERLLNNEYISNDSIIFIDELEAGLHPDAIIKLLDIIEELTKQSKMQFFISSHSYFVIKKMHLMALKDKESCIKCIMPQEKDFVVHDFKEGMPVNPIIEQSVRLYEEEVDEVL